MRDVIASRIMRTTIDLDPAVVKELKRRSKGAGKSMGRLASELLATSLREREGLRDLFRTTSRDQARGNDVPDAPLVTLMRQHGVRRIYSRDAGLRRFADIEVVDPFTSAPGGGRRGRTSTR